MRLLVDCMPLAAGGGVQVAVAFLAQLTRRPDISWRALVPAFIVASLPPFLRDDPRLEATPKRTILDRVMAGRRLAAAERAVSADVVFTVFGPAYFRARAPHVVGFALPRTIYPPEPRNEPTVNPLAFLMDRLRLLLFRRTDRIIVETDVVRERLSRAAGIPAARIDVIRNGVNPLLRHSARAVPDPCFAVLIPSAYYRHKNLEIVPDVAAALSALAPQVDFEFRLTLDPNTRPWRAIAGRAADLGVAHRVVTLGNLPLPALGEAYERASAVFLPTVREASTAVYPEAFFFRRPLVTSDLDFARDLCGDAALFVDPFDAAVAARAFVRLNREPDVGERLKDAGERRLGLSYLSPEEKFARQIAVLQMAAGTLRAQSGLRGDVVEGGAVGDGQAHESGPGVRNVSAPSAGCGAS